MKARITYEKIYYQGYAVFADGVRIGEVYYSPGVGAGWFWEFKGERGPRISGLRSRGRATAALLFRNDRRNPDDEISFSLTPKPGAPKGWEESTTRRGMLPAEQAFMDEWFKHSYSHPMARYYDRIIAFRGCEEGVWVQLRPWNTQHKEPRILLDFIMDMGATPRRGCGSKTMEMIIELADEHGVELQLIAKPMGTKESGKKLPIRSLVRFYKDFGFKGEHRKGMDSVSMRRASRRGNPGWKRRSKGRPFMAGIRGAFRTQAEAIEAISIPRTKRGSYEGVVYRRNDGLWVAQVKRINRRR